MLVGLVLGLLIISKEKFLEKILESYQNSILPNSGHNIRDKKFTNLNV
jgi:hypothetical protein